MNRFSYTLIAFFLGGLFTAVASAEYLVFLPQIYKADLRFGVVQTYGPTAAIKNLGTWTYYQYGWGQPYTFDVERVQMVARPNIPTTGLSDFMASYPGLTYLIGNEPNNPSQDNLTASAYASTVRNWTVWLKGIDPFARIAAGQVVNWPDAASAVAYLEAARQAHQTMYGVPMQPEIWTIHAYSNGNSCDAQETINAITTMATYLRGIGATQVWLTEVGTLFVADADPCQSAYMTTVVQWLKGSSLVDRWYWFSSQARQDGFGGNLVNLDGTLTPLGINYRNLIQ